MKSARARRLLASCQLLLFLCCVSGIQETVSPTKSEILADDRDGSRPTNRYSGPSLDVLPTSDQLDGFDTAEQGELFVGEELYELINGGAVQFFNHGFEWAAAGGYRRKGGDRVTVHVYRMSSPRGSDALFAERTLGEAVSPVVGDRSSMLGSGFDFCRGAFYVTVVSFETGEPGEQSALFVAQAVDSRLVGK